MKHYEQPKVLILLADEMNIITTSDTPIDPAPKTPIKDIG